MGSSIFQVRFGESAHPISMERVRALGLGRTEFAQRLGYVHISKAHKLLTTALLTGAMLRAATRA